MTDLPYMASRLYGTPLLIARPKLEVILGVVARKLAGDHRREDSLGLSFGREAVPTPAQALPPAPSN